MDEQDLIYHVCRADDWQAAVHKGEYSGSDDDVRDGFIHFSSRSQVRESTAKHRAGQDGLVLLAVSATALGQALKWEPSRGGQLFPHLYGSLPISAVAEATPLPLADDGQHTFPPGFPHEET
jgi:uncharacterized protein (DUF952 family)